MRNFPAAFAAQVDRRDGAAPVWLLRFTAGGVDYVLCQDAVTITPWGITALPLIASWGRLYEGVTNTLADYRIADLSVNLINNTGAATTLRARVKSHQLDGIALSVYLWFDDCTDPPQDMYRFRVRDIDLPSETQIILGLQDESVRYENNYIGTVVDSTTYPAADPDDVGKLIPIVFGTVEKLRTLSVDAGIKTTLVYGLSAIQTTLVVSDPSGFWIGMWIGIDDETMAVANISSSTITITRAVDATVAVTHQRGADIIEIRPNDFVYLAADHPLQSITKVWGSIGGKLMDITSIATAYTGNPGSEHPEYPGCGVITVPGFITISQASNLLLSDGIGVSDLLTVLDGIGISDLVGVTDEIGISNLLSVLDNITVGDNIAVSDTIGISDVLTVSDNIGVTDGINVSDSIGVSQGSHPHTTYNATVSQAGNNAPQGDYRTSGSWNGNWQGIINFPAHGINPSDIVDVTYEVTFQAWKCTSVYIYANGYTFYNAAVALVDGTQTMSWTVSNANAYAATGIAVQLACNGAAPVGVWLTAAKRTYRYNTTSSSNAASGVAKTGSAAKSGTITKTGNASRSGTISKSGSAAKTGAAYRGGSASLSGSLSKTGTVSKTGAVTRTGNVTRSGAVTKTGSVTLTGNSVANTLIGDAILVDVVAFDTAPAAVLTKITGITCNVIGSFPAGYGFNGAITTSQTVLSWCHTLARQCRAYFRWILGTPTLIVRPDTLTPVKSINEIRLSSGEMIHGQKLTDINEVINTINLQYDRDWSGSNNTAPYKATLSGTDITSTQTYGIRERPELFKFDFVTSDTMAADLLAFYLRRQAWQRWQHTQEAYLFEAALEFGDVVTLAFLEGETGECIEVGFNPGNGTNIDKIQLTVIE